MSVIVTDAGFRAEDWTVEFDGAEALADPDRRDVGLDLPADLFPEALGDLAGDFDPIALIRIPFARFRAGPFPSQLRGPGLRRQGFRHIKLPLTSLQNRQPLNPPKPLRINDSMRLDWGASFLGN
ncbi:MAG TPA: hypothetical protein DIU07_20715 [Rhodobacteraceae bacterium]|nr:hypothetical protein [Paracoccaceae bacterium]